MVQSLLLETLAPRSVSYSEFLKTLREGRIEEVYLREVDLVAVLKPAKEGEKAKRKEKIVTGRLPRIDESPLLRELEERGVVFAGKIQEESWLQSLLLGWIVPLVAPGRDLHVRDAAPQPGAAGALSLGRNKARSTTPPSSRKSRSRTWRASTKRRRSSSRSWIS